MLMFMKRMRKNKKGFTLTELIVVVAILGVLAAVATPAIMGYVADARNNTDNANAKVIENSIKVAAARANPAITSAAGQLNAATVAALITAVNGAGGNIPSSLLDASIANTFRACQNTANHMWVNRDTLEVRVNQSTNTAPSTGGVVWANPLLLN